MDFDMCGRERNVAKGIKNKNNKIKELNTIYQQFFGLSRPGLEFYTFANRIDKDFKVH